MNRQLYKSNRLILQKKEVRDEFWSFSPKIKKIKTYFYDSLDQEIVVLFN